MKTGSDSAIDENTSGNSRDGKGGPILENRRVLRNRHIVAIPLRRD